MKGTLLPSSFINSTRITKEGWGCACVVHSCSVLHINSSPISVKSAKHQPLKQEYLTFMAVEQRHSYS